MDNQEVIQTQIEQPVVQTQEAQVANEEKQEQQVESEVVNQSEGQTEDTTQEEDNKPKEPSVDELKSRLQEYELRQEEEDIIREKLGISNDVDPTQFSLINMDQQILNQGKTEYMKLCTEFGIDADPDKISKSVEALKASDPAKGYEFLRRYEQLEYNVNTRRQQVQSEISNYELSKFTKDYSNLLDVSPAINNIVSQYVNVNRGGQVSYGELKNVMDTILPAYQEAFDAGKRFALEGKAKQDTSQVSGGIVTANTQVASQDGVVFTREQIKNMSPSEFAKNESLIVKQMREGKII